MSLRYLLVVLVFSVAGMSCNNDKNKFLIVGEIANMPEQIVLLEEMGINETKVLDSVKSNSKGRFELSSSAL